MSFKPLPQIIKRIEAQPQWDTLRLYRRLADCWGQVVGPKVAQHSHPVSLARQILWVATSSSVWAQTLALQRSTLLKKLDILVPDAVK
jgi:predicted nucleic acid-binding Zn ribbon protein